MADRPDLMPSIYGGPAETDEGVRGAEEALYMKGGSRTCERVHLELKIDLFFNININIILLLFFFLSRLQKDYNHVWK